MSAECQNCLASPCQCAWANAVIEAKTASSLAPAQCSAAPDCCAEWTRSGKALEYVAAEKGYRGIWRLEGLFHFCPWCGRARQNEKLCREAGQKDAR